MGDPSGDIAGGMMGAFTSMLGQMQAADARQQAQDAINRAVRGYQDIPLPVLQQLQAQLAPNSAMEGVGADPALEAAQYEGLGQEQRIADNGGMTLEDRANFETGQRDAAQKTNAQRQGIINLMARQGVNPGGASVAMQLGAANNQAENAANVGMQTAADARKRATQAVLDRAHMASSQRTQQFGEQTRKAAARDAVNRYNTDARASAYRYNAGLPQQQFDNRMSRQSGIANASSGAANYYTGEANRIGSMYANAGTGIGQMVSGAYGAAQNAPAGPSTTYDGGNPYPMAPTKLDEEG